MRALIRRHGGRVEELQRIVVGVDGSEAGRIALRWAIAETALWGARLEVLHAWREPMLFVPRAYSPALVEMGRMDEAALEFIGRELDIVGADADCGIEIDKIAIQGGVAGAMIDAAREADLIVLGRHGSGGFPRDVIGPKVVQVAHHAACAVAVIPDEWTGEGRGVVVGVDGSQPAGAALRVGLEEAHRRHASVRAVMAFGLLDQHHPDPALGFDPHYSDADARAALDVFVDRAIEGTDSTTVERVVVNDLPARALIEAAEQSELLVVGARGLGGFEDLLLGSVSHRCLAHAPCPTIVVR